MIDFDKIKELIDGAKKIGLSYHVSPDGDATGSLLALYSALKEMNKDVRIYSKDNLTLDSTLDYLPYIDKIDGKSYSVPNDIDILIIVDCGNLERVSCEADFDKIITLCIDHHVSNDKYCTYNFINDKSSSTGEIIYSVIKTLGVPLNKDIAKCLYTSIMTDTGGLRFESTAKSTFNIVGELIYTGIDFYNIYEKIFLIKEYSKVKLLGLVFNDLKIVDGDICISRITEEMLNKTGALESQTGDVVSYCLTIKGVKVSVLIKELRDKTKVSLRSREGVDVSKISEKFGGGGHIRAAAFVTKMESHEIEKTLIEEFRAILG